MNSVLGPTGNSNGSASVSRVLVTPAPRPTGARKVMPSWFRRAVGNNFGQAGVTSFAGARLDN